VSCLQVPITKAFTVPPPERRCALNKIAWSQEGRKVAVGDARGTVHILGIAEEVGG
jgi:hypothetical protein